MKPPLFAIALLLSAGASGAQADIRHVWAVNDGEKVERDAGRIHPARATARGTARPCASPARATRSSRSRSSSKPTSAACASCRCGCRRCVSPGDRITYQPPAAGSHRLRRPPDSDLRACNYMHVTTPSHASWVYRRGSPAAPADPTGWKPVQLVPENARARTRRPARRRSGRTRTRPSGSRSTSIGPGQPGRLPRHDRDPRRRRATDAPDRARGLRLHPAGREQHARDAVLLERSAGALSRPQSRSPRTIVLPIVTASSWFTPTTSRRCRPRGAVSRAPTSPATSGYEGPGDGHRQCRRPANVLRTRAGTSTIGASAWAKSDSVDDVARARSCRGRSRSSTCPTSRARRSIRAS